jgi:hypothetical protein
MPGINTLFVTIWSSHDTLGELMVPEHPTFLYFYFFFFSQYHMQLFVHMKGCTSPSIDYSVICYIGSGDYFNKIKLHVACDMYKKLHVNFFTFHRPISISCASEITNEDAYW